MTLYDPDDLTVACHAYTVIDQDQDEHDGLRLEIVDTDGERVGIYGYSWEIEALAARITAAVAAPTEEPWPPEPDHPSYG
jgi:hypothetical protein